MYSVYVSCIRTFFTPDRCVVTCTTYVVGWSEMTDSAFMYCLTCVAQ